MALRPVDWCTLQTVLIIAAAVLLYFLGSNFPVQTQVNEEALLVDYSRQPPWPLWTLTQASFAYFGGLYAAFNPPLVRVHDVLSSAAKVAAIDAAVKLQLSEVLANRAMTVDEIADVKRVDARKLEMLLEVLSDAGIFQRDVVDKSRWRNNAQSVLLRPEHPNSVTAAAQHAAASLKAYDTLYESLARADARSVAVATAESAEAAGAVQETRPPADPAAPPACEAAAVPDKLLAALCAEERDMSYVLTHDVNWKQFHRAIGVGGCGVLLGKIRAFHPAVATIPVVDTARLLTDSVESVTRSTVDSVGSVNWGDVVVVPGLGLLSDAKAEQLIAQLHELCSHSGARLLILGPAVVPDDAPTAFLNVQRRKHAIQLMLEGGMLRSATSLRALLTKHRWTVDQIVETRSEYVAVISSPTGNQPGAL